MNHLAAITGAIVVAGAQAVSAATLSDCGELDFVHGGERGHRDLGGGIVSYRIFNIGHGIQSQRLLVESCASGDVISAEFRRSEDDVTTGDTRVVRDATDATYAVLDDAMTSAETVTFAMLEQRFEAAGAQTTRAISDRESCACNRAYPDLRGSRQHFEWYN